MCERVYCWFVDICVFITVLVTLESVLLVCGYMCVHHCTCNTRECIAALCVHFSHHSVVALVGVSISRCGSRKTYQTLLLFCSC